MDTRTQRLTETFYRWEERGRGYWEWNERVILEPLFVPFHGHSAYLTPEDPSDDGTFPSWIERLTASFSRREEAEPPALSPLDYPEEVPDFLVDSPRDLAELQLFLPAPSRAELLGELIPTLAQLAPPLSLEMVGTAESLSVLISFPQAFEHQITAYLKACFPDVGFLSKPSALQDAWLTLDSGYSDIISYGLDEEFLKPLPAFRKGSEPLARVLSILDHLEPGHVAVFQVLVAPAQAPWASSMVRVTQTPNGEPFFFNDEDLFRLVKEKVHSPLYSVVVRTGVRAKNADSCWSLTQDFAQALNEITTPDANALIPLESERDDEIEQQVDLITRRTHRSGMILNEEELALLAHPPNPGIHLKRLDRFDEATQSAPVPTSKGLVLGTNVHRGETLEVVLPDELRSRHMHVIGSTGSGKSNLLLHCIADDIRRGHGVGVIDPHGDLIEDVMRSLPKERIPDVILVDPSDEDYPIPFNILQAHSELERTLLASDLTSIFRRFATSWGDQMTAVLDNAVLALLNHPKGGTLRDLQRLLIERPFREDILREVTDEQVRYYWEREFPLLRGQPQASILTRLSMFLRPRCIRNMLLQSGNALNFESIMDGRNILLVKLSHGLIGESNAHLLGALLVSRINQAVMARQARSEARRTPFWLYMDEFHHFACPSMSTILSGARKYQMGLILAHQDMKQVESRDPELAESLSANPYARICFRLGDRDARMLERGFAHFEASDLQNLPIGQALCRFGPSDQDFNLQTERFPIGEYEDSDSTAAIIEHCRNTYATPKAEVERRLSQNLPQNLPQPPTSKKASIEQIKAPIPPPAPLKPLEPTPEPPPPVPVQPKEPEAQPDNERVKPEPVESAPPTEGLGGDEHRRIQAKLKKLAEGFGYKAVIEKQLPGGKLIDVALEKRDIRIAIEVSVTTPPAKEVQNILKSLKAGYDSVIVTSPNPKTLSLIKNKAKGTLDTEQIQKVRFLTPESISSHLVDLEAQSASGVEEIMGWEVETIYTSSEKLGVERQASQEASIGKLAKQMTHKTIRRKKKG